MVGIKFFLYYFCMMEGSGSIPDYWIQIREAQKQWIWWIQIRIRIRNTAFYV